MVMLIQSKYVHQSVQLASACKSFEAGVDGWLSADSGVRVSRKGVV